MTEEAERGFQHGQLPGSLELALVGDSVYDLYVRERLVKRGGRIKNIHLEAVKRVNAHAQSEALSKIESELTDMEASVIRRARNARQTPTKNADAGDYHRATALEALIGYLYLTNQKDRLAYILNACLGMEG